MDLEIVNLLSYLQDSGNPNVNGTVGTRISEKDNTADGAVLLDPGAPVSVSPLHKPVTQQHLLALETRFNNYLDTAVKCILTAISGMAPEKTLPGSVRRPSQLAECSAEPETRHQLSRSRPYSPVRKQSLRVRRSTSRSHPSNSHSTSHQPRLYSPTGSSVQEPYSPTKSGSSVQEPYPPTKIAYSRTNTSDVRSDQFSSTQSQLSTPLNRILKEVLCNNTNCSQEASTCKQLHMSRFMSESDFAVEVAKVQRRRSLRGSPKLTDMRQKTAHFVCRALVDRLFDKLESVI